MIWLSRARHPVGDRTCRHDQHRGVLDGGDPPIPATQLRAFDHLFNRSYLFSLLIGDYVSDKPSLIG